VQIPRLREWRERRALTQVELAESAGVSERSVAGYEAGRGARPPTVRRLAQALSIEVTDLYGDPEHPLGEAPPSQEQPPLNGFNGLEKERHYEKYEDVLKALGFGQEQIEAWKAQDARNKEFSERELERERRRIEKLSPKELREELMARSLAEKRLRRYYREESTTRERSEGQQDKSA